MPELPEVETVRRGLAAAIEGRKVVSAVLRRPGLRLPFPADLAERFLGRRIEKISRRAKFLLVHLDSQDVLIAHLGMTGGFKIFDGPPPPPEKHDHVVLGLSGSVTVYYHDPRRFGLMDMAYGGDVKSHPLLSRLGPEPLGPEFDAEYLNKCLGRRAGPIKTAIMDQAVVAGMGNIYASECLFRAGISPRRKAYTVPGVRARRLVPAIREVLEEAIAAGGSTISSYRNTDGGLGYFQHSFAVYGRKGEMCPGCDCDLAKTGGVRHIQQAGRSTFYCAKRQR
ncbi:MAG: bifunctional DNA-formamidopyrimidine glycosylase/DNA-(apurinic or apyrimidinic site) lyase [Rhodospirillales bacterium]